MIKSDLGNVEIEAASVHALRADLGCAIVAALEQYCEDDEEVRCIVGGIVEALSMSKKACAVMDIEYHHENDDTDIDPEGMA